MIGDEGCKAESIVSDGIFWVVDRVKLSSLTQCKPSNRNKW